jgi:hypothetical protein
MRVVVLILGCSLGIAAFASDGGKVSLRDVAESAVRQSKLTLPGSKPFHLKAEIVETTNPSSEYQAKIEEYWISPEKLIHTASDGTLSGSSMKIRGAGAAGVPTSCVNAQAFATTIAINKPMILVCTEEILRHEVWLSTLTA